MTSGGVQPEERPVAVVTGASGGIGRAVVDKLIADGMRVAGGGHAALRSLGAKRFVPSHVTCLTQSGSGLS